MVQINPRRSGRALPVPQGRTQPVPLDQIVAVRGRNPYAEGIAVVGEALSQALERKRRLANQAQQTNIIAKSFGVDPEALSGLSPEQAMLVAKRIDEENKGTSVLQVNPDGTREIVTIPGGSKFGGTIKIPGSGSAPKNRGTQLKGLSDQNNPVIFDPNTGELKERFPDGSTKGFSGAPLNPVKREDSKANKEAISETAKGVQLLSKVDMLFDRLEKKSPAMARMASVDMMAKFIDPEVRQMAKEIKQIGFTFGGKNFTGTEEDIIVGTFLPNAFDNSASRELKRKALKGYITGQIDLYEAGKLLGPSGKAIVGVIDKYRDSGESKTNVFREKYGY